MSGNTKHDPGPLSAPAGNSFTATPDGNSSTFGTFCECKCLGLMHLNARSLLPKLADVTAFVYTANPDDMIITESLSTALMFSFLDTSTVSTEALRDKGTLKEL